MAEHDIVTETAPLLSEHIRDEEEAAGANIAPSDVPWPSLMGK